MTTHAFLRTCHEIFSNCYKTLQRKNEDYTQDDPFSNFYATEIGLTTKQAIMYMIKIKYNRLANLTAKDAEPNYESLEDTVADLINYAVILGAYLADRKPTE